MTPERWQEIKSVLEGALGLDSAQRSAYLDQACPSDRSLRREVESLLAADQQAQSSFLQSPPLAKKLVKGTRLGDYEIDSLLGAGGMGEVYRARDLRLRRDVAVKVLPPDFSNNPERLQRFEQEAMAAAALSHPNILAVHQLGTYAGTPYLVSELLEGETLRGHLNHGRMALGRVIDYGVQIAYGLSAAHEKGIVHRDLKPENLFLTKDGQVKILDFGLAKLVPPRPVSENNAPTASLETEPGVVMGTAAYMSPEQVRAEPADHRADIFAFGAILYEMLTGKRAFQKPTSPETMTAILHEAPPEIAEVVSNVPLAVQRIVERCLEKMPARRFQSTTDLKFALEALSHSGTSRRAVLGRTPTGRNRIFAFVMMGAVIAVVAAILAFLPAIGNRWRNWLHRSGTAGSTEIHSLAVLPLENLSGDPAQEFFADGMTEELTTDLSKIKEIRVISRTSAMRFKGATKALPEIAKELNVDGIIEGSVGRAGDRVRITAQLIHAPSDTNLWAESYERDLRDVLTMEGEIARDITEEIRIKLSPQEKAGLTGVHPIDPLAHEAYLKGHFHLVKRTDADLKQAVDYFRDAIRRDPNYAESYNGLGYAYCLMGQYSSLSYAEARRYAEPAVAKALQINPDLADAHVTLAYIHDVFDKDWATAGREYKRAIELDPNNSTAHEAYSGYLSNVGRQSEAMEQIKRAHELDPLSPRVNSFLCWEYYFSHDYDQALAVARKTFELDPNHMPGFWCAGMSHSAKGDSAQAIAELQKMVSLAGNTESQAWLAYVYAVAGQRDKALEILQQLLQLSKRQYVSPYQIAEIYTGLGDLDHAFEWWNKARQTGFDLIYLTAWPANDVLRKDIRYKQIIESYGLPQ